MIESTLPTCMSAIASWRVVSISVTPSSAAKPARSLTASAEWSSSTQPKVSRAPPLPWKMSPNRTMNTSGKASVQKTAARSRV